MHQPNFFEGGGPTFDSFGGGWGKDRVMVSYSFTLNFENQGPMGKINTILNENRIRHRVPILTKSHAISYTRFGGKNRVCCITTVVKVLYNDPR